MTRLQASKRPPCFTKAILYPGAPLPSTGSARAAFPGVISTIGTLRLPVSKSGSLIYSLPRCSFLSPRSLPCGGDFRWARSRSSRGTTDYLKLLVHRISQVPAESIPYLCPAHGSRPAHRTSPLSVQRCSPRFNNSEDTSDEVISRLNHAASVSAAYASSRALPHAHARLASGWWLAFAGRESNPLDSFEKFPSATSDFLLPQAYPGAMLKN